MREDYLSVARVLNLLAQVCGVWGQGQGGRGMFCSNFLGVGRKSETEREG